MQDPSSIVSQLPTAQQGWASDQLKQGVDPAAIQAAVAKTNKPNFLERILPTIGSIGGGILGSFTDPVTGPLGSIGGAAAGSALGQKLENELTGNKTSTALAGLEGGAGQAVGLGIGAIGGKLLGSGADALGNAASDSASADAMNSEFGGVSSKVRAGLNMNSNAAKFGEYGLPYNVDTINAVAPVATGSAEAGDGLAILHKGTMAAMEGAGPVDLTGTQALTHQIALSPDLHTAGPSVPDAFRSQVIDRLTGTISPTGESGSVGSLLHADASSVFQTQQALEKLAYQTNNPALSQAYKDVATSLDSALQRAGANDVAAQGLYSPEDLNTLATKISPKLAEEAANVKTVAENRALSAPFVQSSHLANAASSAAEGALPATSDIGTSLTGKAAAAHDIIKGGILNRLKGVLSLGGQVAEPAARAGATALTAGAGAGVTLPSVLSQFVAHAPSMGGGADAGVVPGGSIMNQGAMNMPQTPQPNNNLDQEMALAGMYAPSMMPALQQEKAGQQGAEVGQQALGAIEKAYGAAGGGQGMGSGILSKLTSIIPGTSGYQYHHQIAALAQDLASALSASTGQKVDPAAIAAELPSLLANPEAASSQFGALQSGLSPLQSPTSFQANPSVLAGATTPGM